MTRVRLLLAVLVFGVLGAGVSVYLTAVHFSTAPLVCSTGGIVNCERVLSSPYGTIAGTSIPTSTAGILWFLVSAALAALRLRPDARARLAVAHLAWGAAGLLTALYLVFVEINRVGAVCAWCTAAHTLVLLSFLALLTLWSVEAAPAPARR